ncbi:hypothetical protein I7I50_08248 [Histoplasma capsulatum G186AR]|uniref:Uncharacterized protein n=1 Tax=Ajellomyces capsulatus TaxID=5037 RepID=A0A8H7YTL6_AJECA|nr:hypothetical protein I7I52_05764 [Histoplasma capsulatum]QSS73466.1 hypothetical protein I7I50_08248 [Histoplasma capsulatum G186AR]
MTQPSSIHSRTRISNFLISCFQHHDFNYVIYPDKPVHHVRVEPPRGAAVEPAVELGRSG